MFLLASCQQGIIEEPGSVEVLFCPSDECEDAYASFLRSNKASCAFYDLDSAKVITSIFDDDVLVFEDNYQGIGIKVGSHGLMHNKFCVSNNRTITGSANPTDRGFKTNYNHILLIESDTIAGNYREEFGELKAAGQEPTRYAMVNLSGVLIENYFCPEDDCENQLLEELSKAKESIYFMTFTFTSDAIGDLLVEKSREVSVEGLMESFGLNQYSEFQKMEATGIPILLERTDAILHHKVFIIDKKAVIAGSYNPTKAANERNDENILIIHDTNIASKFLDEYSRIASTLE